MDFFVVLSLAEVCTLASAGALPVPTDTVIELNRLEAIAWCCYCTNCSYADMLSQLLIPRP